ncbi:MAG: hypothetical protein ACR5K4_03625 [Sodalis sp. (in: enterobacteria)]
MLTCFLVNFCVMLDIRLLDLHSRALNSAIREKHGCSRHYHRKISIPSTFQGRTFLITIKSKLTVVEKRPALDISDNQPSGQAPTKACSNQLIAFFHAMPNAIIRMSYDVKKRYGNVAEHWYYIDWSTKLKFSA